MSNFGDCLPPFLDYQFNIQNATSIFIFQFLYEYLVMHAFSTL